MENAGRGEGRVAKYGKRKKKEIEREGESEFVDEETEIAKGERERDGQESRVCANATRPASVALLLLLPSSPVFPSSSSSSKPWHAGRKDTIQRRSSSSSFPPIFFSPVAILSSFGWVEEISQTRPEESDLFLQNKQKNITLISPNFLGFCNH